jgi:hypothetical protein
VEVSKVPLQRFMLADHSGIDKLDYKEPTDTREILTDIKHKRWI